LKSFGLKDIVEATVDFMVNSNFEIAIFKRILINRIDAIAFFVDLFLVFGGLFPFRSFCQPKDVSRFVNDGAKCERFTVKQLKFVLKNSS
jgi:hypothetical protein